MNTPNSHPLKALIFDVDGTLAETERDGHLPAFNGAFAAHGLNWHWDASQYGALLKITGGKERMRHFAQQSDPESLRRPDFDALIRALHADKTVDYVRRVSTGQLALRPGVAQLIQTAREAGLRLAIATTTSPENVTALLSATLPSADLRAFEIIGAGDVVAAKKPAPDIYAWVVARLGLAPAQCLAIEDSRNGLLAAQGANIPCIVTRSEYTQHEDFSGALAVLPNLTGITLSTLLAWHHTQS